MTDARPPAAVECDARVENGAEGWVENKIKQG